MALRVVPQRFRGWQSAAEALTARLVAAYAGAVPLVMAVAPPAVDPVSLRTAAGFSVPGGVQELGRCWIGVGTSGASYAAGDAATYLIAGLIGGG